MHGKITRIAITYTVDTSEGPRHTFHGLPHMRQHLQPERLQHFLDELTVICEDLLVSRTATPANGLDREGRRGGTGVGGCLGRWAHASIQLASACW